MGRNRKYLLVSIVWAIIRSMEFMAFSRGKESMTSILINIGLGQPHFSTGYMTLIFYDLFPIILFQMIFGVSIYQHFCIANAYYFSRLSNKLKWYKNEVLILLSFAVIYFILYIGTTVGIMYITNCGYFDSETLVTMFYVFAYESIFTFAFTLLINIISIIFGSHNSFVIVFSIQVFCISSLLIFNDFLSLKGVGGLLFKLNPISNLIFSWHSSDNAMLNSKINIHSIHFSLNSSLLYLVIISSIVVISGALLIKKVDIALENKEVQG
jgi:hypothetical protein